MSEIKKFTQEELEKIKLLRDENSQKILEFGQIELELIITNKRLELLETTKKQLHDMYMELQNKEQLLVKELNEKYGAGTVDLESGEFISS